MQESLGSTKRLDKASRAGRKPRDLAALRVTPFRAAPKPLLCRPLRVRAGPDAGGPARQVLRAAPSPPRPRSVPLPQLHSPAPRRGGRGSRQARSPRSSSKVTSQQRCPSPSEDASRSRRPPGSRSMAAESPGAARSATAWPAAGHRCGATRQLTAPLARRYPAWPRGGTRRQCLRQRRRVGLRRAGRGLWAAGSARRRPIPVRSRSARPARSTEASTLGSGFRCCRALTAVVLPVGGSNTSQSDSEAMKG